MEEGTERGRRKGWEKGERKLRVERENQGLRTTATRGKINWRGSIEVEGVIRVGAWVQTLIYTTRVKQTYGYGSRYNLFAISGLLNNLT